MRPDRNLYLGSSPHQRAPHPELDEADLDELDFTDSTWHLNEEQAFILAEALMTPNTVVKKLDLAMNQTLGDDGKVAISELLLPRPPLP